MNTPMIAAKTNDRNAPVPAVRIRNGMMMNTDDAGVTADSVIAMFPRTPRPRWSSCSYFSSTYAVPLSTATLPTSSTSRPDASTYSLTHQSKNGAIERPPAVDVKTSEAESVPWRDPRTRPHDASKWRRPLSVRSRVLEPSRSASPMSLPKPG